MKESFLADMKLLYPHGLNWDREKQQHRDLIRVYSMGWCDALISIDAREAVLQWIEGTKIIADLNWWPDATWRW